MERENLAGDAKGKGASGSNREAESTDAPERGGLPRNVNNFSALSVELVDELDDSCDARQQDAGRNQRANEDDERQSRKGGPARPARGLHRQEYVAAFARRVRRAEAGRPQRYRRT